MNENMAIVDSFLENIFPFLDSDNWIKSFTFCCVSSSSYSPATRFTMPCLIVYPIPADKLVVLVLVVLDVDVDTCVGVTGVNAFVDDRRRALIINARNVEDCIMM